MSTQKYCLINENTNICDNVVVWDGDPSKWMPPENHLALVQATTPTKVWVFDQPNNTYVLEVVSSARAGIGFTWDGIYLITNESAPPIPSS